MATVKSRASPFCCSCATLSLGADCRVRERKWPRDMSKPTSWKLRTLRLTGGLGCEPTSEGARTMTNATAIAARKRVAAEPCAARPTKARARAQAREATCAGRGRPDTRPTSTRDGSHLLRARKFRPLPRVSSDPVSVRGKSSGVNTCSPRGRVIRFRHAFAAFQACPRRSVSPACLPSGAATCRPLLEPRQSRPLRRERTLPLGSR